MIVKHYPISALPGELVGRWNELIDQSSVRSAFLTYDFCRAVDAAFGDVVVLHLREDEAEGFLPVQFRPGQKWLGHAQKVGGPMSDYFGIVGNIKEPIDLAAILRRAGIHALRFDHGVPALCPFPFDEKESTKGVRVEVADFTEFMKKLSRENKKFPKLLERCERKLQIDFGQLEFEWNTKDLADLPRLIDTKREQYARTGARDGLKSTRSRRLLGLLAAQSGAHCSTVLSTLHCGGRWIASNLSLLCRDTMHIWYPAYDPDFRNYSPGHLLFSKMMEHGSALGVRVFDFGAGEAAYKKEYRGEAYDLWKGVARSKSASAQFERALRSLEWRVDGWLR